MDERALSGKIKSFRAPSFRLEGLELAVGKVIEPEERIELIEPMGPTPKSSIQDLREWDEILLKRYRPFYAPSCDMCCFCTYGKCDLTGDKKGVCGIDIRTQQARWSLLTSLTGMATHFSHAKELVKRLLEKKGNVPIYLGDKTPNEAPITRVVTGIVPKKLSDLTEAIEYVESQIPDLVSSCHTGQEGSYLDFESKALHAGMLDALSMEIADIAQMCALDFPKAEISPSLVEIGAGTVDTTKPVILCIGHNVAPGSEIIDYAEKSGLSEKLEVCGICCTAHDLARYRSNVAKIVGPISMQRKFVRSGIADVIVTDEQCIIVDILEEAKKVKAPLIATSIKVMYGLPDKTKEPPEEIVKELLNGAPGVLILDPEKAGEVAVRVAMKIKEKRKKYNVLPDEKEIIELAKKCNQCKECIRACPKSLNISEAMQAASKGDISKLAEIEDACLGCRICEGSCKRGIPILNVIIKASEKKFKEEKSKIRAGRGAISDYELRMVADTWGTGVTPGCIALVGCANYPGAAKEVFEMAKEFLERGYIVVASGCAAMTIAMYKDEEGMSLYEKYHGIFDASGMLNIGSCVSNAHIIAAGIRLGAVFARRVLRGNFAEIADYLINRVGACGIAWGAYSQKAHSIAGACNRFGIPVIVGPHGSKYRRLYLGRKEDTSHMVYDMRTGEKRYQGLYPEHLLYAAESKEEAMVMAVKLCFRNNDIEEGKKVKIANYIDFHLKYFGEMPEDLHTLVRTERDIPANMKDKIMEKLNERGWKPWKIPWDRMKDVSFLEKDKLWTYEAMRRGIKWFTV